MLCFNLLTNPVPHGLEHTENFLVLHQSTFATNCYAHQHTDSYLHWENNPKIEWKIFKKIDGEGDAEGDAEGWGYIAKLLPEGIAKSFASVPGVEIERNEAEEDGGNKHPIYINEDTYTNWHYTNKLLYYFKI